MKQYSRPPKLVLVGSGPGAPDLITLRGTVMLLLGIDVELRLGELVDFVGGLFLVDLAGDDERYERMRDSEGRPAYDVPTPPPEDVRNPAQEGDYDEDDKAASGGR